MDVDYNPSSDLNPEFEEHGVGGNLSLQLSVVGVWGNSEHFVFRSEHAAS